MEVYTFFLYYSIQLYEFWPSPPSETHPKRPKRQQFAGELNSAAGEIGNAPVVSTVETPVPILSASSPHPATAPYGTPPTRLGQQKFTTLSLLL